MKLSTLNTDDKFILQNKLDPELSRWGKVIEVTPSSVKVRWERHVVNDANGELEEVKPYTTTIARDTEVLKCPS